MTAPTVLVIGGGFAGVAAAARARSHHAHVVVLDDRPTLGGRARSDDLDGVTVDTGAQIISASFAHTVALLGGPSAPDHGPLRTTSGRDVFVRDGQRYPVQFGSVRSLLSFGGLGTMEKLKLTRHLLPLLAMHRSHLDAAARRTPPALDRESARSFLVRHVTERAADALVEPALNSFYAARGDETSLAFYLTLARYGADSEVLAPIAGWSRALAGALRGARHEPGVRVMGIELGPGRASALAEDGRRWDGDGIVLAAGPRSARMLLAPHIGEPHPLVEWVGAVELRPTWTVALAVRGALDRKAFGVLQDAAGARLVSACAVHGGKVGTAAPADRDVVLAWPTPRAAMELAGETSEGLVAMMMPEIERLVPDCRGLVSRARVYRFDEGTPLLRPGFVADHARGRALAEALATPVALAGDYLATPLVEGAVESGEWAADLVLRRLGFVGRTR